MNLNSRVLPDFDNCYAKHMESVTVDSLNSPCMDGCGICCQWNLQSNNSALKKIKTPEHYPKRTNDEAPIALMGRATAITHIQPVKQDFEWLVQALNYAAYHVDWGLWNKDGIDAYLQTWPYHTYCVAVGYGHLNHTPVIDWFQQKLNPR